MNNLLMQELNVVIYARVSTESLTQETSITNQISYFEQLIANNKNWHLVRKYLDIGISGKNVINRKEFLQMINDAKRKNFDLVLTKSVSRFARNTVDSINYTNYLKELGIYVYFINDNINTYDSDSEFRLTLMSSLAQDEIRKLSESIRFGLNSSVNRGIVLGNNNILGYDKKNGKLTINKEEATIVENIFNLYLEEKNYTKVVNYVNSKFHKNFNATSIKRILTNYKYKGYYCGKKTQVINYQKGTRRYNNKEDWLIYKSANIPVVISENIWNQVNDIINKNKRKQNYFYCYYHGKTKIKSKHYKDKIYSYIVCPKCFTFNLSLFNNLNIHNKCYIKPEKEDYILTVVNDM